MPKRLRVHLVFSPLPRGLLSPLPPRAAFDHCRKICHLLRLASSMLRPPRPLVSSILDLRRSRMKEKNEEKKNKKQNREKRRRLNQRPNAKYPPRSFQFLSLASNRSEGKKNNVLGASHCVILPLSALFASTSYLPRLAYPSSRLRLFLS